jgi:hypothetical protein
LPGGIWLPGEVSLLLFAGDAATSDEFAKFDTVDEAI